MNNNQTLDLLRQAIEAAEGRPLKTPKDFEALRSHIYEKQGQYISTSTLKRIWGYIEGYASVRTHTLDLLAQYIDYPNYEHFCQHQPAATPTATAATPPAATIATPATTATPSAATDATSAATAATSTAATAPKRAFSPPTIAALLCLVALIAGLLTLRHHKPSPADADTLPILRAGQTFSSTDDYLRPFGITDPEHFWDVPLPSHPGVIVWSPEYHHPVWHNDGDSALLMPTITERWAPDAEPDDTLMQQQVQLRNENLYYNVARNNELRVTFMKNITDSSYVFLGIYRADLTQSDSTHIVWQRVANRLDLAHIDHLEQLRH